MLNVLQLCKRGNYLLGYQSIFLKVQYTSLQECSFICASLIHLSLTNKLFVHEDQQATVRVTAKGEMDECALVQDGLMCMVEDNKQIQTQHPSKP